MAVSALALAACGGGDDDGDGEQGGARAAPVSVQSIDGSDVLVDARGRALYSADQEVDGQVRCTDGCTSIWDPVVAEDGAVRGSEPELGVVRRPDGTRQLTFQGSPLYRFTEEGSGQLTGDGVVDEFAGVTFTWQKAAADDGGGAPSSDSQPSPDLGY